MDELNESTELLIKKVKIPAVIFITENDIGEFSGLGSGFLMTYKNKKFVISCGHVIRHFYKEPKAGIYLNYDITKIVSRTDIISKMIYEKPYDIGYLMLKDDIQIPNDKFISAPEQLELSIVDWKHSASIVYGFPGELMEELKKENAHVVSGFSLVGTYSRPDDDGIRDHFDYPEGDDVEVNDYYDIPDPEGISGSAIWRCTFEPNQPLDYENAKIYSIQNTWCPGLSEYTGTKIGYILELIDKNENL